ncbi:3-hydroxybutyryl-CoA dehydrogenase [Lunatimonas lonarensis]|uniref:3-hydroxybutyryl-CoA dehydrogenase n=1 Tax=Lunatimonas lonarensis TaxID=1232681 RepID=R7ZV66_9BACT|nr:3-hydroxyacyl-CoA dehydrogenase NAD-binding domain-containing protein [Lunatimonas lonarensis]EON77894.1 3-hydroxybutyryl-CoA dehydrogenase [Lunatimonas lonarensis]
MNMEIHTVTVVGAGTLGSRVALQCALSGYRAKVYDLDASILETSKATMQKLLRQLRKQGSLLPAQEEGLSDRLLFTDKLGEAVEDADLINESVTENLETKLQVWKQIDNLAPEKTIFTTNTSFLLPSKIAAAIDRPQRFCALHFHDVFFARLLDIMAHSKTDLALIPILEKFGRSLNQVPVVIQKEYPGYLFNTMLMSFIHAAGKLLTRGVGSIEDIDRSWMVNFHMAIGPFGILDQIGLDTAWHVTRNNPDKYTQAFADLLADYIKEGKLGEKVGAGFYSYPNPRYRDPNFLK